MRFSSMSTPTSASRPFQLPVQGARLAARLVVSRPAGSAEPAVGIVLKMDLLLVLGSLVAYLAVRPLELFAVLAPVHGILENKFVATSNGLATLAQFFPELCVLLAELKDVIAQVRDLLPLLDRESTPEELEYSL
jgi:hypothetical protein